MESIKGTLERHVTGRLPHTQDQYYKVPFVRAVYKSCDKKDCPPKTKHIRNILSLNLPSCPPSLLQLRGLDGNMHLHCCRASLIRFKSLTVFSRIVLETHNVHGGVSFFREMAKSAIFTNEISCWKAFNCVHRVLMEGHPQCLKDAFYETRLFQDLKATFSRLRGIGLISSLCVCAVLCCVCVRERTERRALGNTMLFFLRSCIL